MSPNRDYYDFTDSRDRERFFREAPRRREGGGTPGENFMGAAVLFGMSLIGQSVETSRANRRAQQAEEERAEANRRAQQAEEERAEAERQAELERQLRLMGKQPDHEITEAMITQGQTEAGFVSGFTHVAFCGNRGVGKSSMINALLGLKPIDHGAAPTGTVETTRSKGKYIDVRHQGFIWYDIPGAGTADTTAWQYYYKQSLFIYDLVVIVHNSTLQEADINTLRLCTWRKQPHILVRTKSNEHIRRCSRDRDLSLENARAYYLKEARRDASRETTIGEVKITIEDCLVSNDTIRTLLSDDDNPTDPSEAPIDEAKFLQRLGVISRPNT